MQASTKVDSSAGGAPAAPLQCLKCKQKPVEFETDSCHHACFCRSCAMKCASGGKCKICNQFYAGLTRISHWKGRHKKMEKGQRKVGGEGEEEWSKVDAGQQRLNFSILRKISCCSTFRSSSMAVALLFIEYVSNFSVFFSFLGATKKSLLLIHHLCPFCLSSNVQLVFLFWFSALLRYTRAYRFFLYAAAPTFFSFSQRLALLPVMIWQRLVDVAIGLYLAPPHRCAVFTALEWRAKRRKSNSLEEFGDRTFSSRSLSLDLCLHALPQNTFSS